jgi:hypothetical protein
MHTTSAPGYDGGVSDVGPNDNLSVPELFSDQLDMFQRTVIDSSNSLDFYISDMLPPLLWNRPPDSGYGTSEPSWLLTSDCGPLSSEGASQSISLSPPKPATSKDSEMGEYDVHTKPRTS